MRWLSILVLALALVAAGCGGGDDESSASGDTTVEETTTTEATTEDDGSGATGDFDFADEDCQALVAAYVEVSQAFAAAAGGSGGDLAEQADAFEQFAGEVPEEIRADVETLAAAYGQYVEAIQAAGLEPGEIPSAEQAQELQDALQDVGSADVTAASERLSAWTQENCTG